MTELEFQVLQEIAASLGHIKVALGYFIAISMYWIITR